MTTDTEQFQHLVSIAGKEKNRCFFTAVFAQYKKIMPVAQ
jgi:hypothetical protein